MVIGLVLLTLAFVSKDALRLNPAEEVASPYIYDLIGWHLSNFLSKWVHRVVLALPWDSLSKEEKQQKVEEYFRLREEVSRLQFALNQAAADTADQAHLRVKAVEAELKDVMARRGRLRNDVEETIEAAISSVVSEEGLDLWGDLIFPPVDIRLINVPRLLVTSPRDRILRTHDVLIDSDISVRERERIENELLEGSNLSALVLNIGGVATYPASVPNGRSLQVTLQTSAHEWLHHYYFFRPLGQNMFTSGDMQILNETIADIAGREIGDRAFKKLGGNPDPAVRGGERIELEEEAQDQKDEDAFDFRREMRKTRLRTDELLAEGKIEEAEAYMEERRKLLVENRVFIRKINQAFFAFNGTYAESAASISPIAGQLYEFRGLVPDLGTFIRKLSGVSSHREFLDKLEQLKAEAGAP